MRQELPDELRALLDDKDGRTIDEMIADDEVSEYVVEKAEPGEGGTTVTFDGGLVGFLRGPEVKVADTIGLYCDGRVFGGTRHGWALNGKIIEWQTPFERVAKRITSLAEGDRERREKFAKQRDDLDRRFDALPAEFQERIERRRRNNPAFRQDFESYELFVCEQAVAFAEQARARSTDAEEPQVSEHWKDDEESKDQPLAVRWLYWWSALNSERYGYDFNRQKAEMPAMDEGHSGNTFGAAVQLAYWWLVNPENVDKQHGAMAPLVGSQDYGDVDG